MYQLIDKKNKISSLEKKLISIINDSILMGQPQNLLKNQIKKLSSNSFKIKDKVVDLSNGKLYVLGWGKVAGAMAHAIESILGTEMIEEGIVVSNFSQYNLKKIKLLEGTHPFPSKKNTLAAKRIRELAKKCKENDYVICLISGGGSSLLCLPIEEISLDETIEAMNVLIKAGMDTEKMNIVRKHISRIKGGRLAKFIYPANIINLMISDVMTEINAIASGCTMADHSTFEDALNIINKYGIKEKLPASVVKYIESNLGKKDNETIKEDSGVFDNVVSWVIYDNKMFLENIKKTAIKKGFDITKIYPKIFYGDIKEIKEVIRELCLSIEYLEKKSKGNFLVVGGGEVEIKAKHGGKGGRAQHFAALMIPKLKKFKNSSVFAAIASDGNDFIRDIGGAIINDKTIDEIAKKNIDYKRYIKETDTFHLHKALGTLLFTIKPTQTNVFDAYIFCRNKED